MMLKNKKYVSALMITTLLVTYCIYNQNKHPKKYNTTNQEFKNSNNNNSSIFEKTFEELTETQKQSLYTLISNNIDMLWPSENPKEQTNYILKQVIQNYNEFRTIYFIENKEIKGFLAAMRRPQRIFLFATDKGQGYGSKLLDYVKTDIYLSGDISLQVLEKNEYARHFYEKREFTYIDEKDENNRNSASYKWIQMKCLRNISLSK
jgi:GNAT superfamily N-acetyltransferase